MRSPNGAGMQGRIKTTTRPTRSGVCSGCMQRKALYYMNGVFRCSDCKRNGDQHFSLSERVNALSRNRRREV